MQILMAVSMLLFIGVCSVVGVRVLLLARRTHGAAELFCGLGFTSIGLLGYPAAMVSGNGVADAGDIWLPAYVAGQVFTNLGLACFFAFTRVVFRPHAAWAGTLCAAAVVVLIAGAGLGIWQITSAPATQSSLEATHEANLLLQATSTTAFLWTAIEGARQWQMARRRSALFLAEPVVANRFLLWAVFGLSTTALSATFGVAQLAGVAPATSPAVHLATAVFGVTSSVAVSLGFFPPRAYRAMLERRAPAAGT